MLGLARAGHRCDRLALMPGIRGGPAWLAADLQAWGESSGGRRGSQGGGQWWWRPCRDPSGGPAACHARTLEAGNVRGEGAHDPALEVGKPALGRETPLAQAVGEACRVTRRPLQRPFTPGVAGHDRQSWLSVLPNDLVRPMDRRQSAYPGRHSFRHAPVGASSVQPSIAGQAEISGSVEYAHHPWLGAGKCDILCQFAFPWRTKFSLGRRG
jgi:hypothetical protein